MSKDNIQIGDFNLFIEVVKSLAKFAESAKFSINENGLTIYSKNNCARCEMQTNAVTSKNLVEINVADVQMLLKILITVKEVHENDYSDFKFLFDGSAMKFESKKMKTKLTTCRDSALIEKWISKKLVTPLQPVFEFSTTSDMIKRLNNHSFIMTDSSALRVYLQVDKDLEKNVLYATLGNETNNLNNSLTLKFGLVTFGSLDDRKLVLDFERLNIFNMVPSNDMKIQLMDKNVLVSKVVVNGKNGTVFNLTIYNSLRKN